MAPYYFPSKAYTFYGPKYANANYPTFIEDKGRTSVAVVESSRNARSITVEQRSMQPGYGSHSRGRMMGLFLPRGPVSHAGKENPSFLMSCL